MNNLTKSRSLNFLIRAAILVDKIFYFFSRACIALSGFILVIVTLTICAGVFNRAFTSFVWLFVEEWSGLALIPISYLAFGYTLRQGRHLKMDLIVRKLPRKAQNIFALFTACFCMVCLGFMVHSAFNWFWYTFSRGVVSSGPMQTPLWIFSFCILVSLALLLMDMLMYLVNRILIFKYPSGLLHFHEKVPAEENPPSPGEEESKCL